MWRDQLEETIRQEAPALFWDSVKRDAGWAHARKGAEKQSGNLVAEPNLVFVTQGWLTHVGEALLM